MQKVPYDIWTRYDAFIKSKVKDGSQHENLRKWFLYFWDFTAKYPLPDSRPEQVRLFIEKLVKKGQNEIQQKQAAHAVSLYFQMRDSEAKVLSITRDTKSFPLKALSIETVKNNKSRFNEWRCFEKTKSPEWDRVIFLRCKLRALNKSFSSFSSLAGESKFSLKSKKSGLPPSRE